MLQKTCISSPWPLHSPVYYSGLRMPILLLLSLLASGASSRQEDSVIFITGDWADASYDDEYYEGLILSSTEALGDSCPVPSLPLPLLGLGSRCHRRWLHQWSKKLLKPDPIAGVCEPSNLAYCQTGLGLSPGQRRTLAYSWLR